MSWFSFWGLEQMWWSRLRRQFLQRDWRPVVFISFESLKFQFARFTNLHGGFEIWTRRFATLCREAVARISANCTKTFNCSGQATREYWVSSRPELLCDNVGTSTTCDGTTHREFHLSDHSPVWPLSKYVSAAECYFQKSSAGSNPERDGLILYR